MSANQNKHSWSKNTNKGKEQQVADKETDNKDTAKKGKTKKHGYKEGTVLGEINDD
ncbi:hypothetical protein [Alkalimonas sp.]|uniref:hypothetical protein n=1 Tax=Alkalimonas sp. TaxID=1872453 RepID=UPI00263B5270|nr:hypothetical protein [Alkalimonas sp.]MCC5825954.1 hypothetical protein [Alkalimonas sp.]